MGTATATFYLLLIAAKPPFAPVSSDHFKKECSNRNRKDNNSSNGSNIKLLGNSANTVEEDNDYAFTVEETLDDERSMNASEKELEEEIEEFEEEVEDQSDVEEFAADEIVSNVELMTT